MFILNQDMTKIINTEHIVKIATDETVAPTIRALLDTGEGVILGTYLPEDTCYRDEKFLEIVSKLTKYKRGVMVDRYRSEKPQPGDFV